MSSNAARRVTIVGNGPLPDGAAERIDASDAVIRFNNPVHSIETAGLRTDILFVLNSGKSMQARLADPAFATSPFFLAAREIVLPYDPEIIRKYHPKPNLLSYYISGRRADWTEQTVRAFEAVGKTVRVLSAAFYEECCDELGITKTDRARIFPSTGFIGIRYAMAHYPKPGWTIDINGFSWTGWKRHDWHAEEKWARSLLG